MNTPTPPKRNKYTFHLWDVGGYQSFVFDDKTALRKCRAAAHAIGCRLCKKFVTKMTRPLILQVWRVK